MKPFYWKLILIAVPNIVFGVVGNLLTDTLKLWFGAAEWFYIAWPITITGLTLVIAAVSIRHVLKEHLWSLLEDVFAQVHVFIHKARDLFVIQATGNGIDRPKERNAWLLSNHESKIDALLEIVVQAFKILLPRGTKVIVAIRERKSDDNFRTWVRAGDNHPDRAERSEDLKSNSPVVTGLISSYMNKQDCVIYTGPSDERWIKMANDQLGQDKSVLMAGIFVKKWDSADGEFLRPEAELRWILCVATNHENQLKEKAFKELLKCFNDTLAIILNMAVRSSSEKADHGDGILPFPPRSGDGQTSPPAADPGRAAEGE